MDIDKITKYKTSASACIGLAALIIMVMMGSGAFFGGGITYFLILIYSLINAILSLALKNNKGVQIVWVLIFLNIVNLGMLLFGLKLFKETGEEGLLFLPLVLIVTGLFFLGKYLHYRKSLN